MATDSISGLKKQIEETLVVLDPQIRGIDDLLRTSISNDLAAGLSDPPLLELNERADKSHAVLDDIDKLLADLEILENDGWPEPQNFTLPVELQVELAGQVKDLTAGAGIFKNPASPAGGESINVTMSAPIDDLPARSQRRS